MAKPLTTDERLNKIDEQLERIARAVAAGFANSDKKIDATRDELRGHMDIYARGVNNARFTVGYF